MYAFVKDKRTPQGLLKHMEIQRQKSKRSVANGKNRERKARQYQKMRELYGGDPSRNFMARARWLLAKERNQ